jgi:hypothetical protein
MLSCGLDRLPFRLMASAGAAFRDCIVPSLLPAYPRFHESGMSLSTGRFALSEAPCGVLQWQRGGYHLLLFQVF